MESFYKVSIKNNKEEHVSCVNPDLYGYRFFNFISKEVIINEKINRDKDIKLDNP